MAYREVSRETVKAPTYALKNGYNRRGREILMSTKIPTGSTVETEYIHYRCDRCHAPACAPVGEGSLDGTKCGKCKS